MRIAQTKTMMIVGGVLLACWIGPEAQHAQAEKEWTPQDADRLVAQTYQQLLLRSTTAVVPLEGRKAGSVGEATAATYASELTNGRKSVRHVVEAVALSREFQEKWIRPHMGGDLVGPVPGLPPVAAPEKAIDSIYCALLGRRVDRGSLAAARKDMVRSGIDRVISDILVGKEYRQRFGDDAVPSPSRDVEAAAGCPQVAKTE